MAVELFTREGVAHSGAHFLDSKGRPCFHEPRACSRCGGAGRAEKWAHTGYNCFDCNGSGRHVNGPLVVRLYTQAELDKLNPVRDKARARKAAKHAALVAEQSAQRQSREALFRSRYGALIERAMRYAADRYGPAGVLPETVDFIWDVANKADRRADMTPAQADALAAALDRWDAEQARKAAASFLGTVGERLELTARVVRVSEFTRPAFGAEWTTETVRVVSFQAGGDTLVTFTTSRNVPAKDDEVRVRGTVKEHKQGRNGPETILTRVTYPGRPRP